VMRRAFGPEGRTFTALLMTIAGSKIATHRALLRFSFRFR
jgi:hypothetical protein